MMTPDPHPQPDAESPNTIDPRHTYGDTTFGEQTQQAPGLESAMNPVPDAGELSYRGCGRLKGKRALVTGGDSGIGRAAAIAFAREGADIALNYLPSEQSDAEEVARLVKKEGRTVALIPGDLSNEAFCRELVAESCRQLGGLEVLALCAGTQTAARDIRDITTDQLEKTFAVNVFSLFWIMQAAIPHLQPGSSVITCSSIQAYRPGATLPDYAATKAAIIAFSRSMAKQLAPKGIRVNCVAPGPVWTPLQVTGGQFTEDLPKFGKSTPLGRAGQPAELAGLYVFLASDEASFITAEVFGATGGKHLS